MAIAPGIVLGPYEILAHIGSGGMGEVWRARDQRIGRDVAVKVLPEAYAPGDDRLRRFEQEARAAGALSHPGLVTIYDVGTFEGAPYIVMELLEGETLRQALGDGVTPRIPLSKTIDYAMQIAGALALAHEKGIVHRDLKPENLFITSDGRAKIFDFGLAKLAEKDLPADDADRDRSRTARHLTSAGMVIGTPGYMSPEQISAKPVDARTDIFSFGAVLYEMIGGRRAFDRDSAIETMAAILNEEPEPLVSLAPKVPPALEAIVAHCMEKNPRERFQSARDLAFQLRFIANSLANTTTSRSVSSQALAAMMRRRPPRWMIGTAVVLALAAAGFTLLRTRGMGSAPAASRTFQQLTFGEGLSMFPSLSPDGKSFAYVSSQTGNRDIYVQRVDWRIATDITNDSLDDDSEPAFSPDGAQIAFRSERDGGGIFVMGVTGESVRRLTDFGYNPAWSPDGSRIVFATQRIELRPHIRTAFSELWIVNVRTGARQPLVQPGKGGPDFGMHCDAVQPSWSPNGKRIAFWGVANWLGERQILTIDPDAPQPKQTVVAVTSGPYLHWNPVWSPDGKYLYYGCNRDETLNLWRVPVDQATGRARGEPEPLSLPATISGNFSVSPEGGIAYTMVNRSFRLLAIPFDAASGTAGPPRPLFGGSQEILSFDLSPDGRTVAYTAGGRYENVFIADVDGSHRRQLTNDPVKDKSVTWSADGLTLFFHSNRDGHSFRIWSIHADGSGLRAVVDDADHRTAATKGTFSPRVSSDPRIIAVDTDNAHALLHLDRPSGQRLEVFPQVLDTLSWSPDGARLAGDLPGGQATGRRGFGIYSLATRRLEKTVDGGGAPEWLPDGRRVVFFEKRAIGIYDVATGRVTTTPFTPPPGVDLVDFEVTPRLSRDGSLIIVRQSLEQGDIWLMRSAPAKP
jgi:serine/threonine protein kinase